MPPIPKLISQTWSTKTVPAASEPFCRSWRQHNPDFAYRLFDDEACAAVVAQVAPDYLDDYLRLPFPVMRADFFRYAVIYRDGGLYADIDMQCLRPVGHLLSPGGAVFSTESRLTARRQAELGYARPFQVANCIFAASPGHPFLMEAMRRAAELTRGRAAIARGDVEDLTGPRMLTRLFYERERPDMVLLPQIYLMAPCHYPDIRPLNRNVHARHHFFGSWKSDVPRSLSRIWIERDLWPDPWARLPSATGPGRRPGATSNRPLREARRFFGRFGNLGPLGLAATAWRAMRLGRQPTAARPVPPRAERVVIALTTVPERAGALRRVLSSLLDQSEPADRIVLALPRTSLRGAAYPDPAGLGLPAGVDVIRCEDAGPATKLLPALKLEPEAVLIVVDDDVVYPRTLVETLLAAHRERPHAALGLRGVRLVEGAPFHTLDHVFATGVSVAAPVDILFGTWGYLVPPGTLGEGVHDLASAPDPVRWVDDVWVSGHLARAGVPRYVVPACELPLETRASRVAALTYGINSSGENDETAIRLFSADW